MPKAPCSGYTFFEMLCVLLLIGGLVLGAIAIFGKLAHETKITMETDVAGRVRSGLNTFFVDPARGNRIAYPSKLDHAPEGVCNIANPCFDVVLHQDGVTQIWSKLSETTYRSPANATNVWTYTPETGAFEKTNE